MTSEGVEYLLAAFAAGAGVGSFFYFLFHRAKLGNYNTLATDILRRAELEAQKIKQDAELAATKQEYEQQRKLELTWQTEKKKLEKEETRLKEREDKLESRMALVDKKLVQLEKKQSTLSETETKLETEKGHVEEQNRRLVLQWAQLAGMTSLQAKEQLWDKVKREIQEETDAFVRDKVKCAEEDAEKQAGRILATAINRLAVPCVSELTVDTVTLPNDEIKGRIIGREGRNIRAFERTTGTTLLIDDTPGAIVLSCFDPVRLHTAKVALTELVQNGRIHPSSIEEAVEHAKSLVEKKILEYGEDAALRAGQRNLHPEILKLLGKMKFRLSLGQNVLEHSLEVSHLMGMMAAELRLDEQLAKRIGLLHDMGKAVSHEMEGTHAVIGHDLALRYGESEEVANGIGCHHFEMEPISIEGALCHAADSISASRPGARTEALEEYIKRIQKLEDLAYSFPGVEKAYAMQAGKEVCILVRPEMIDDNGALNLARELGKKIEQEVNYPGKIKVTVVREKRAVVYA